MNSWILVINLLLTIQLSKFATKNKFGDDKNSFQFQTLRPVNLFVFSKRFSKFATRRTF